MTRSIGIDFIYLDLIFLILWFFALYRYKYWKAIIWGFSGFIVYFIVEYVLWYSLLNVRKYEGPIPTILFFIWLAFSPGFAQFSYVALMFENRSQKAIALWTVFFYLGWMSIALGSQWLSLNDTQIMISRDMSQGNQRSIFIALTFINLITGLYLVFRKQLTGLHLAYIFLVGILVELNLELSLTISQIRQEQGTWSLQLSIVNTLIEFNMGIVFMYLILSKIKFPLEYREISTINSTESG